MVVDNASTAPIEVLSDNKTEQEQAPEVVSEVEHSGFPQELPVLPLKPAG